MISSYFIGRPLSFESPVVVLFFYCCPAGDLSIVVALSFAGFSAPSCMAAVVSHFYFGHHLGSPLFFYASCLDDCLLLSVPLQWGSRVFLLRNSGTLSRSVSLSVSIWDAPSCMAVASCHL